MKEAKENKPSKPPKPPNIPKKAKERVGNGPWLATKRVWVSVTGCFSVERNIIL
jgi:hypothetical protein